MVAEAVTSFATLFGVRNLADLCFIRSHYLLDRETTFGFSSSFPKQLVAFGIGHVQLKSVRARLNDSMDVDEASQREVARVRVTNHLNSELRSLCREGKVEAALELMEDIEKKGASVDPSSIFALIEACVNRSLPRPSISVFSKLIEMYAKLSSSEDAHKVFEEMPERVLNSWHKILAGRPRPDAPPSGLELSNKSKLKKHWIRKQKQQRDPKKVEAYQKLESLSEEMKEAGYVADTKYVLHDIDEEAKEKALMHHSERLAIAYGLISTPAGTTLRIMKNLRICGDCHNAIKIISKIEEREIIVRDNKRFHHFKDGKCSCGDYW